MVSPCRSFSRLTRRFLSRQNRQSSSQSLPQRPPQHDPYALLSKPTWSIRTLLPPPSSTTTTQQQQEEEPPIVTADQLAHLLRLSALPQPPDSLSPEEKRLQTRRMLADLDAQLHFVRDIQRVDTEGVDPLPSIRDETAAGLREAAVTVETLRRALAEEEVVGRCRRPRRRRGSTSGGSSATRTHTGKGAGQLKPIEGVEDWDVLGTAAETVGRYFVVRSGTGGGAAAAAAAQGNGDLNEATGGS
ncbi:hypothetical protein C7999DRAFT_30907 [Corynascus novoguineensis]|uniref:Glutamyl-tRNA amidotransferase complex subunit Gta3 domain-containing protein n=1 Tax=Corynascus novoguineensis TaxID=1126955 RepID=A0AAN7CUQ4_9PEZI|nr:hypothetical protein C7999DRAFT_30907 [Corynascus novoguineensis]